MYLEIRTKRLLLRPLNISDLDNVHEYVSDEENIRYVCALPNRNIEETEMFLSKVTNEWEKDIPGFYELAIELDGVQIGHISVYFDEKHESGELGWLLNKKYWHNGYATEAAAALKDYIQKNIRIKRLIAHCDYRNIASSRVMEKIGLRLESDNGTRFYPKRNETAREFMYSLIL